MTELEVTITAHDIRDLFPRGAKSIGERAAAIYLSGDESDREHMHSLARYAATYVNHVHYQHIFYREGDMALWFGLQDMPIEALAENGRLLKQEWQDRHLSMTPAESDLQEQLDLEAEEEEDRISELENGDYYGRTLFYQPECERWIYIRFGRMPEAGQSVFGLAGEDNEDGPDEWRVTMGNMTHEAGVCVLRAYHHPNIPGAYVIMEPAFPLALYHVSGGFESYLNSIIPRYEEGEHPSVLRLDGSLATCKARDGTTRIDLGSDGEFMINSHKPVAIHHLDIADIWLSESKSVVDLLEARRGIAYKANNTQLQP